MIAASSRPCWIALLTLGYARFPCSQCCLNLAFFVVAGSAQSLQAQERWQACRAHCAVIAACLVSIVRSKLSGIALALEAVSVIVVRKMKTCNSRQLSSSPARLPAPLRIQASTTPSHLKISKIRVGSRLREISSRLGTRFRPNL